MTKSLTFVIPVGDDAIYQNCFVRSPLFAGDHGHEILCQRGFKSAPKAFNAALDNAHNDLVVFCHQDIILPRNWVANFLNQLEAIAATDPNWGVVGCAGRTNTGMRAAHLYRHDREFIGDVPLPSAVRTLDECIIAFRRSSGLRFDEAMLGFFFYAVDICMQAESKNANNYVVDSPCFHQGKDRSILPPVFYEAEQYMIRKWQKRLPIQTLSGLVAGNRYLLYKRIRNRWEDFLAARGIRPKPWWSELPKISPEQLLQ